jgi:transcriptional regulator with XRE-family HTH domain
VQDFTFSTQCVIFKPMEVFMDKFGMVIKEKRISKGETRAQLANKLGCSEAFVRHIEESKSVPISLRILSGLKRHYRSIAKQIDEYSVARNKRGSAYYKKYRLNI